MANRNIHESKLGLYFNFRGDREILNYLNLKLEMTMIVQKPFIISIPIRPLYQGQSDPSQMILDPLINVETFSEINKDLLIKNKGLIRENVYYIYFPSNIRVDEKIYKIYLTSYQNTLKEIPKNLRGNIGKLIIFQNGTNQHSIEYQKNKCFETIGLLFKVAIQKKVQSCISQINQTPIQQLTLKALSNVFKNKNRLAYLYRRLGLDDKSAETLTAIWQDLLYNYRVFSSEAKKISSEININPPYINRKYINIVRQFETPLSYLKICNFTFFRMFEQEIELTLHYEAIKKLKHFIQFTLINILAKTVPGPARYLWIVAIFDEAQEIMFGSGRSHPTFLNTTKEEEYNSINYSLNHLYRQSLQNIGSFLFRLDPLAIFPRNFQFEVELCLSRLNKDEQVNVKEKQNYLLNFQIELRQKIEQNMLLVLSSFQSYKYIYLKAIICEYEALRRCNLLKNTWTVKISILKCLIYHFNLKFNIPYRTIIQINPDFFKLYGKEGYNIEPILSKIIKKVQKIVFEEDQYYINQALFKMPTKYESEKDIFLTRNQEDESLWKPLKILEDYYKFSLFYANRKVLTLNQDKPNSQESIQLSFSRSEAKHSIRIDSLITLILNQYLFILKKQWKQTFQLIRNYLENQKLEQTTQLENEKNNQKSSQVKICKVKLGVITSYTLSFVNSRPILKLKLNNRHLQKIGSMKTSFQEQILELTLIVIDKNDKIKKLWLNQCSQNEIKIPALKPINTEQYFNINFQILNPPIIIFIIKQLQILINGQILLYYTNKTLELYEIKKMEVEGQMKGLRSETKKTRRYSQNQEKEVQQQNQFFSMLKKQMQIQHHFLSLNILQLRAESQKSQIKSYLNQSQRSSGFFDFVKQVSQSVVIYSGLWTPVQFKIENNNSIKFNISFKILINKLWITCTENEQINEWIMIDHKWYKIGSQQKIVLMLTKQKPSIELRINIRSRGSLAQRGSSKMQKVRKSSGISRSILSQNASNDFNGSSIRVEFEVEQQEYSYRLSSTVNNCTKKPIQVRYHYCQDLEQYTIANLTEHSLKIQKADLDQQNSLIRKGQQVKLQKSKINISIVQEHQDISDLTNQIDLKSLIRKELLRPANLETCELQLNHNLQDKTISEATFKKFKPIRIMSKEVGKVSIADWGKQCELVGKIEGECDWSQGGSLFIIPTKVGRVILPSILINGKKGIWECSVLNITE